MEPLSLLGATMGLGFVSGLNLYASVLTIGLGVRLGLINLPPDLSQLELLSNPYVLGVAGALYLIEFLADKIPWVDSLWDTVHAVIRPVGAIAISSTAIVSVDPVTKTILCLICGGVAFSGHSAKAGTRLAANHSPEPFTNIGLSITEDVMAIAGTWLAVTHPLAMLVIVTLFLILFFWVSPKIFRLIRVEFIAVSSFLKKTWSGSRSRQGFLLDNMPERYTEYWQSKFNPRETLFRVRCVAGKGVKRLRNSVGYLHYTDEGLIFLSRRLFRFRTHQIDLNSIESVQFNRGILLDRVTLKTSKGPQTFLFFKHGLNQGQEVHNTLSRIRSGG